MTRRIPIRLIEKLEVGHPSIDAEHRDLLALVEGFRNQLEEDADSESLVLAIGEIIEYTRRHFANEEALMDECGYPEMARHVRIHRELLEKAAAQQEKVRQSRLINIEPIKLYSFLVDWFIRHVVEEDRKLADYLKNAN
ncbi:MAG: hemerythrin family protein [Sulfuricella sp.]|nr:hemerythrin family protein [Sulfuricella sp.]